MLKNISALGNNLNKEQQKKINDGCPHGGSCSGYNGPVEVTCEQYWNLPTVYQMCVDVPAWCFDN